MGAWSMAVLLWQPFEYYYYYLRSKSHLYVKNIILRSKSHLYVKNMSKSQLYVKNTFVCQKHILRSKSHLYVKNMSKSHLSLGSRPSPFTHAYISKRMRYLWYRPTHGGFMVLLPSGAGRSVEFTGIETETGRMSLSQCQ